jgi:excisionase family DNA binding protein
MDRLLSPEQAAELLGVTADWVHRRCQRGELPFVRLSGSSHGRLRIREGDLERWVRGRVQQRVDAQIVSTGNQAEDEIQRRRRARRAG